jgi:hypothetical protein
VSCKACGGEEDRRDCQLCLGVGFIPRHVAERWERTRQERLRITKQFHRIEVATRQFVKALESRKNPSDSALAAIGRGLLAAAEGIGAPMPGTQERKELVNQMLGFNARAITVLLPPKE